jgi:hypothetical protein
LLVLNVENSGALAPIEDETFFYHSSDFLVRCYEAVRGAECISDSTRAANPVVPPDLSGSSGALFLNVFAVFANLAFCLALFRGFSLLQPGSDLVVRQYLPSDY